MRIKSVRVRNFRCLDDVSIDFDSVTTFVGPNGAGKSTVLRALDWFFNDDKGRIAESDVYSGATAEDPSVSVEVTFDGLTERDRAALGDIYAPAGTDTFTAWRVWQGGVTKTMGRGRAFPSFDEIRAIPGARERRAAYEALRENRPELGLAKYTNADAASTAMRLWEAENPSELSDADISSTSHFFGFNGRNVLSGLFDFVLVTADLRAGEESIDGRATIIGRILERAIDRSEAQARFAELADDVARRQAAINDELISGQLSSLGDALTAEVSHFTIGREIRLTATNPELKPPAPAITVSVGDALTVTPVDRQGHGFQRALLISSLKLLAQHHSQEGEDSVICLAIEEPELFQHPGRARVFARVLRALASESDQGLQVTYATHSPHFVDARYFDQVRRVTRSTESVDDHPTVSVRRAALAGVVEALDGFVSPDAILGRWQQVCTKNLADAFFADAVVLVEGDDDKGVLDGIAQRTDMFEVAGICVAVAGGKGHLYTAHSILTCIGIPTLVVYDNDSGCRERTRARILRSTDPTNADDRADQADMAARRLNRDLLRYFGLVESDFPVGDLGTSGTTHVFAWDDCLEHALENDWPEWNGTRDALVDAGVGVGGKNAATYAMAAAECPIEPAGMFPLVAAAARALVGDGDPIRVAR